MKISLFNKEIDFSMRSIAIIVAAGIMLGVIGFSITRKDSQIIVDKGKGEAPITDSKTSSTYAAIKAALSVPTQIIIEEEIKVYIIGCVKTEGIVTLKKGQIIDDAIKKAGGLTSEADPRSINLAYQLNENVMLKVNSKKEMVAYTQNGKQILAQDKNHEAGPGIEIIKDSAGAVISGTSSTDKTKAKININTATLAELDTLPRIGEKTAKDILAYREKTGGFKKIEDIMEVSRIGEKTFNDLKDLIVVK